MTIHITKQAADPVQQFFSRPLTFAQKMAVTKNRVVEQFLERLQFLGLNRRTQDDGPNQTGKQ